ncbi:DUF4229 domain-containing protein [Demequina sp. NBRC 110053]|uniref:DUF4229 domain-containing protein n=1 Tax=Demequina sp. NBRC 110053 TaxID=1570342 RepID=UPI000A0566F4|nr:DUF4229 domain-containing protein [Demequina sp. NBRC 110053]
MKIVAYWGARTGIFVAVLAILAAVGWFDIIAVIAALVIAWLVSYLTLPGLRRAAQEQMASAMDASQRGIKRLDAEEDQEISSDRPGETAR